VTVDPRYREKVRRIRRLLAQLGPNETAVFQDEVDVHLNPKIGSCWMPRGQQATVVTPGNNEKRHVAGSLHWRTGGLLVSPPGRRRDSRLFVNHLDDLRRRLRGFRRIHVICDNAAFHRSHEI
jgi:putative transposase